MLNVIDRRTGEHIPSERLKTYAEVLCQYHLSSEGKFANGQFLNRGRTQRRNVIATTIAPIGKEANQIGASGEQVPSTRPHPNIFSFLRPPACLMVDRESGSLRPINNNLNELVPRDAEHSLVSTLDYHLVNLIDSIAVEGFWGDRELSLTLRDDVSFLIGPNGSGKTTLINLVAATLNADFLTLDRIPFTKITVTLKEVNGRKKPSIMVEKEARTNLPFPSIRYSIKGCCRGNWRTTILRH